MSNLSESGLAFDYRMECFDGVDVIRFVVIVTAAAAVVVGSSAVAVDIGAILHTGVFVAVAVDDDDVIVMVVLLLLLLFEVF